MVETNLNTIKIMNFLEKWQKRRQPHQWCSPEQLKVLWFKFMTSLSSTKSECLKCSYTSWRSKFQNEVLEIYTPCFFQIIYYFYVIERKLLCYYFRGNRFCSQIINYLWFTYFSRWILFMFLPYLKLLTGFCLLLWLEV